jgi:hypothetical protein
LRLESGLKNTVAIREEKEGEAVFLGFGVVSALVTGFQTCSFAEASPKHQKSSLRPATLFFKTLYALCICRRCIFQISYAVFLT